jgi:hypothetical protein
MRIRATLSTCSSSSSRAKRHKNPGVDSRSVTNYSDENPGVDSRSVTKNPGVDSRSVTICARVQVLIRGQ